MELIKIKPVPVSLGTTANAVLFQVMTLDLSPSEFKLNARFFNVEKETKTEVANVPFELPLADYETWTNDEVLADKCLTKLNLEHE